MQTLNQNAARCPVCHVPVSDGQAQYSLAVMSAEGALDGSFIDGVGVLVCSGCGALWAVKK